MTVSVIIPSYNAVDTLDRALDSCLAQNVVSAVLVIDDASTDNTTALARGYRLRDARVALHSLPVNGGPARARNWGAFHANTPLLAFLDADDEYMPGALDAAAAYLAHHPREAVIRLDVDYHGFPAELTAREDFAAHAGILSNTVPSSLVMHRRAFLALGGFPLDECFRRYGGEDGALSWAIQRVFGQKRLINVPHVRMHYHPGIHAERFLRYQMKLAVPNPEVQKELIKQSRAFVETACRDMQTLHEWMQAGAAGT